MNQAQAYGRYLEKLLEITSCLNKINVSQSDIDRDERNAVSNIENTFMTLSTELKEARKTVRNQYSNVWDSCVRNAGLRKPSDQRPAPTELNWKEAIRIQEEAASKIRDWFTVKNHQAYEARQKKVQEEQARKEAIAAAEAEAARKRAAEVSQFEKERAEALVEALKRKHRNY